MAAKRRKNYRFESVNERPDIKKTMNYKKKWELSRNIKKTI